MSDRFYTEITIGGPIEEKDLLSVELAIDAERPWSDIEVQEGGYLKLTGDEISWGEFSELEPLLRQLKIPYDKYVGDACGYSPSQIHARPGFPDVYYDLTIEGTKFFEQDIIRNLIDTLPAQAAVDTIRGMLTEVPPITGMTERQADLLADVAEHGVDAPVKEGEPANG